MENKPEKKKNRAVAIFAVIFAGLLAAWFLLKGDDAREREAKIGGFARESRVHETPSPSPESEQVNMPAQGINVSPSPSASPGQVEVAREIVAPAESPSPSAAPVEAAIASASPSPDLSQSKVELKFRETLPWLVATMIEVQIDGKTVATTQNDQGIGKNLSWPLTNAQVSTGVRNLDVIVKLVGDSDAFPYLSGYTFTMKKSAAIPINGPTVVRLEATPKGNATDDWTQRVNLEFHVEKLPAPARL